MYRAGIIGLGRIGVEFEDSHANAYKECSDTDLLMLADIDSIRQKKYSRRYAVLPFSAPRGNYISGIRVLELDIVSVCTPVETHCEIVCDIAPHVKAIYCEKPMATTLEECDKMIEVCRKHNVILQINHQRRFVKPKFIFNDRSITLSHVFDLIRQHKLDVDLVPIDQDESKFELTFNHNPYTKPMILAGVNHLVDCLQNGYQSISSGEEGKETLRRVLEYERETENANKGNK